ncbi:uncharacterized protein Dana_GF19357 [Drosophila ananassae]|uniref:Uncharacterized protein n=1 Tax=Drosophila ananassae TaxID=7217 RepID=B3MXX0_DROAN|nr:rhythmically expressed gene 2 protein [Drosophila ananassae]EDV38585.1 uncharacterized protein Dana_GF19357 [Drosophila ananassae]KAH8310147.1 hypothetical protein KR067_003280 [Drosophila pandora]
MSLPSQFLKNLKRFRLVTFDVTDTLLRLEDPLRQYHQTATECGLTGLERNQLEGCFRRSFSSMSREHPNFGRLSPGLGWQNWWLELVARTFTCASPGVSPEQLETIGRRLITIFRTSKCWGHIEGAQELVQSVRQAGKHVGVISNFDPSLPEVLAAMGFADKFDFVLTSYEAGVMKPDTGIFSIPLQRLNLRPEQALHIGNKMDMDYTGARNSGWSGLLIAGDRTDLAKHSFSSLSALLEALATKEITW